MPITIDIPADVERDIARCLAEPGAPSPTRLDAILRIVHSAAECIAEDVAAGRRPAPVTVARFTHAARLRDVESCALDRRLGIHRDPCPGCAPATEVHLACGDTVAVKSVPRIGAYRFCEHCDSRKRVVSIARTTA